MIADDGSGAEYHYGQEGFPEREVNPPRGTGSVK